MNYVNAELTKLSVNTFVTTKISYANMLAEVCETLPGADVDVVTSAIGCDSRIGRKYLKGAMGYGGPCFPRDNIAFSALARAHGVAPLLAEATDDMNRQQIVRIAELLFARLPEGGVAAILGLSYKPDTEVVEESQGLGVARQLLARGARVTVYDPAALENARPLLQGRVTFAASASECARHADVIAITTPWDAFRNLSSQDLKSGLHKPVILDCWRILRTESFRGKAEILTLGSGSAVHRTSHATAAAEAD